MSESNNHPNRSVRTPEQRQESENRRAAALQVAGQVHQGSRATPKQVTAYAEQLVKWVRSGKSPE
jgi:hypothetical protein